MSQLQKELNPELFGDMQSLKSRLYEPQPLHPLTVLEDRMLELKKQMLDLADSVRQMQVHIQESIKTQQLKFDKVHQMIQKLEANDQALNQEAAHRIGQLHQRIVERKSVESKVQEMVDRHNSVIKSFEVRLSQMQKMLAEKEAMALSAQASLNETKMELARLKRM